MTHRFPQVDSSQWDPRVLGCHKGKEKGRKREERERRKEKKKGEEERKKKEEKEGVLCSEQTRTEKNPELRYKR